MRVAIVRYLLLLLVLAGDAGTPVTPVERDTCRDSNLSHPTKPQDRMPHPSSCPKPQLKQSLSHSPRGLEPTYLEEAEMLGLVDAMRRSGLASTHCFRVYMYVHAIYTCGCRYFMCGWRMPGRSLACFAVAAKSRKAVGSGIYDLTISWFDRGPVQSGHLILRAQSVIQALSALL